MSIEKRMSQGVVTLLANMKKELGEEIRLLTSKQDSEAHELRIKVTSLTLSDILKGYTTEVGKRIESVTHDDIVKVGNLRKDLRRALHLYCAELGATHLHEHPELDHLKLGLHVQPGSFIVETEFSRLDKKSRHDPILARTFDQWPVDKDDRRVERHLERLRMKLAKGQ